MANFRRACVTMLTTSLVLAALPFGCGGAQDDYVVIERAPAQLVGNRYDSHVPGWTVREWEDCAKLGTVAREGETYRVRWDVNTDEGGKVVNVRVRSSTLADERVQECMRRALGATTFDMNVLPLRSSAPFSGGERMRQSGEPMGHAAAGGGIAVLGPVVIVMAGAYIMMHVAVQVVAPAVEATIEAAKRRRAVEKKCKELMYECLENSWQPEWNRELFGDKKDCGSCYGRCEKDNGQWPQDKCPRPGTRAPN